MNASILKSFNLKITKRRIAILNILESSHAPMTAEEIFSVAVNYVEMNLSTTYRTLCTLSEKGVLLKILRQDGKAYYQINSHQHKHHLICTKCNKTIPIEDCPLSVLEEKLTSKTGFTITSHNLEFLGTCPKCNTKI